MASRTAFGGSGGLDLGLLLIRLGVGGSVLIFHGYSKIAGGPDLWMKIGSNMGNLGIRFLPVFWGFMSGAAEFFASALLILGLFCRPAAALLAINMVVAMAHHLHAPASDPASGWNGASHALELCSVYLGLLFLGPGRFSLTPKWHK